MEDFLPILDSMTTKRRDLVPAARVVRQGPVVVPPPRTPLREHLAELIDPLRPGLQTLAVHIVGLWPIWVVGVLAFCLLWVAALQGSP
jgi:hypothetical protein